MNLPYEELLKQIRETGFAVSEDNAKDFVAGYADKFFSFLGAAQLESLDASDYEGATIVHDLNRPIHEMLHEKFSAVVDLGTLEHIFDFPAAITNCMVAVRNGGYFLGAMPTNNAAGHGFYQFSPELLFRVLSKNNGFNIESMFLAEQSDEPPYGFARWEPVSDPMMLGHRVEFRTNRPTCLLVTARKLATVPLFSEPVQQSDYVTVWQK